MKRISGLVLILPPKKLFMHLLLQSYTSNYKNKHLIYSKDFNYFSLGARPPEQLLEVFDMTKGRPGAFALCR